VITGLALADTHDIVNPQGFPIIETKPQYKNRRTYVQTKKRAEKPLPLEYQLFTSPFHL